MNPKVNALRRIIEEGLKENKRLQSRRMFEIYELLVIKDPFVYKNLGIAILLFITSENERGKFFNLYRVEGLNEKDIKDIKLAVANYKKFSRTWKYKKGHVVQPPKILSYLLSLIVYIDKMGTDRYSMYRLIEDSKEDENFANIRGRMSSNDLKGHLERKDLSPAREEKLIGDRSIVALAILFVLQLPYRIAPVKDLLNEEFITEIGKREKALRVEIGKIIEEQESVEEMLSV